MKLIGYWHDTRSGRRTRHANGIFLPHPQSLVDPTWERERRGEIATYLEAGRVAGIFFGKSYCRFGCGSLGYRELTDGEWVWPDGLAHYVREHQIRLPDELVAHAASRNFHIPEGLAVPDVPNFDLKFWCEWGERHAAFGFEPNYYECTHDGRVFEVHKHSETLKVRPLVIDLFDSFRRYAQRLREILRR